MNKDCLHRMEVATMMSTTGFDFLHVFMLFIEYRSGQIWMRVGCSQLLLASIVGK